MRYVVVESFGGPEQLRLVEAATPEPGPGQVRVELRSIGMNQADLLGRQGGYKASTGDPPYTPGVEGGGVIDAVGEGVDAARTGQRVTLAPTIARGVDGPHGGTYRTHMVVDADAALPAPDALPDDQLGAVWLPYLTAWGALAWKRPVRAGDIVGLPAASSSVALAAAQIVKHRGGIAIGLTSSESKVAQLEALDTAVFDHLVVTHDRDVAGRRVMRPWHRQVRDITDGKGVDLFFDPVAAGAYLSAEVRCLASGGMVMLYGLLGEPGVVDLQPLIIRRASVGAFVLDELRTAGDDVWRRGCQAVFAGFAAGVFRQHVAGTFRLDQVQHAHAQMSRGRHIGKLVLVP